MTKQKFRFADLYKNNKTAVEKALSAMWCGEPRNDSQRAYVAQLSSLIPEIFAPKDAIPLVQCMNSYKTVSPEHAAEAERMLGELWRKTLPKDKFYLPYEHQYQCWKTLLEEKSTDGKLMSIVVTTGTGSGKTECFMLPLVKDLIDNYQPEQVQAIFLYPLNALMEDQKARMEAILAGTELTFAVYNGDMPERIPNKRDKNYKKVMRRVDAIRGVTRDDKGNVIETKFPHVIATREELRNHPANILLTNPTMLEYIMLRDRDESLIKENQHSLRWIALDETHTYTGAGAAEMAMLLRRVLMAYGVSANDIRFATSSATIGNNPDGDTELELRQFIARITGLQVNQVRYVNGDRKGVEKIPEDADKKYWLKLIQENTDGFIRLDELFENEGTVEEMLEHLDRMCQKAEDEGLEDLKVKVHYFYRVPNQGLYVDISDPYYRESGCFKVYTENKPDAGKEGTAPLLELSRCKHCGEYVAIAEEVKDDDGIRYQPITSDDSDMFDLDFEDKSGKTYYVFGATKSETSDYDNNVPYIVEGDVINNVTASRKQAPGWRLISNAQCCCPYCGTKLTKQNKNDDDNPDAVVPDEQDAKKLQKFRVASDFISRLIAPSTLDLMTEASPKDPSRVVLHHGQQYISFVDSRQMAARSTIKQNLEEERLWVYGTIFHELCRRSSNGCLTLDEAKHAQEAIYNDTTLPRSKRNDASRILDILEGDDQSAIQTVLSEMRLRSYMSWQEIYDLLYNDKYADVFCQQFAERSELSSELDDEGNVKKETKRKYIFSVMVEYLSKRPLSAAAPETMGLFTSHYEKLESVFSASLPSAVEKFNGFLSEPNQISRKDWHDLLQVFLDFTVRSNESVFLKMADDDSMDIFKCVRFATQKERRRPVRKPEIKESSPNISRIIRLLAQLISTEKHIPITDAINVYRDVIQDVIDSLWHELTDTYELLNHSTHYDDDPAVRVHVKDKDIIKDDVHYTPYRLNLANLGFKLYSDVYLCDTNVSKDINHVEQLRPIGVTFHGYSPYIIGGYPTPVDSERAETWEPFPFFNGSENGNPKDEVIEQWAKENRSILWKNNLWGESGTFADRLLQIYQFPDLFIQAEHTAQVDKLVTRQLQEDFKDHAINILACSTTMELGVDLGDLELVMMTSVPPQPSNYKQRAGRSGRRGQVRSACITLCGTDAVGARTLINPMENIVLRNVASPTVDLNSAQVIQRHINSFLVREFGVFKLAGGSITEKVIHYYTNYDIVPDGDSNHIKIKRRADNSIVSPIDGLGDENGTPYAVFNENCAKALGTRLRGKLLMLLDGTIFCGKPEYVVAEARKANERCYVELEMKIQDLAEPYKGARSAKQQSFFEMKFIEPLATQLLSYWATHRFTPNANMPVNVIEFDINSSTQSSYTMVTVNNPSYPLRTALSQYAPGNPIARDGIVRIVRGIRYTDFFKPFVTFKKLYYNREQVVIDCKDELDGLEKWPVNSQYGLDLLQPAEFIPDMNESANRILDQNLYTRVSAQLIGADEWKQDRIEPHLFDARSSRESGNGYILYYNEGLGYGYCHCTKCGKTVLETWAAASSSDPDRLPNEMNTIPAKDSDKEDYHFSLVRTGNKPNHCIGCTDPEYIKRNVVLGDTIQTDYTEIRIRHLNKDWINTRKNNESLLVTLGILFTSALAEELNIERGDIDFTITPNGHICVFDTNPGGSGYANQLAAMDLLKAVIDRSDKLLKAAKKADTRDALVDRYTLHYINMVDMDAAKDWLVEEISARKVLPEAVAKVFPDATETSLAKMESAFALSRWDSVLFVDDDYKQWDYDGAEHGWRGQFFNYFATRGLQTSFCVAENTDKPIKEPNIDMVRSIRGWAHSVLHIQNPYLANGLYPLAYIDGRIYFTNNPEHITLNDKWGNGTIYYARANSLVTFAEEIDTTAEEGKTKIFTLSTGDPANIDSCGLGELIYGKAQSIVDSFIAHCHEHSDEIVNVEYQDEHMKSVLSIMLCLQTINYFLRKISNQYSLAFKVERYDDAAGRRDSVTANQPGFLDRDAWINRFSKEMVSDLEGETGIVGHFADVVSVPRRSLTHWRVLSLECAGKTLSIYPDGGLLNGWHIAFTPGVYTKYEVEDMSHDTIIPLYRNQDIKYDVNLE